MTLKERIEGFAKLGGFINDHYSGAFKSEEATLHEGLKAVIAASHVYNNWFVERFVNDAIRSIGSFLSRTDLENFTKRVPETTEPKTVAIICAGNIPMVGFHDIMCVLLSGHRALVKMSSDDNVLLPFFLKLLVHYAPAFEKQILFAEGRLGVFDAVIATGSNNTATHFLYYFKKYPHVIRRSRTSIAVLDGTESDEDLKNLGADIFQYFGLGCRNVSKVLVPKDYNFHRLFESILDYGFVVNNKKYGNNYDYHRALYLLESIKFLDNNFLMIRENSDLHSPVGVLYYEQVADRSEAEAYIAAHQSEIQCVVGKNYIPFGYSQRPVITDFADNIDTVGFLVNL